MNRMTEIKIDNLPSKFDLIKQYLSIQAYDQGLWSIPRTAPEAYVKEELRKLIFMIEDMDSAQIQKEIKNYKEELGLQDN